MPDYMRPSFRNNATSSSKATAWLNLFALDTNTAPGDTPNAGFALVFLHYFGGSSNEWTEIIAHFAPRFRCVAPDLRGHGQSPDAPEAHSVDDMAGDVRQLLETIGVTSCVLVGHSMGGKIALALAAAHGDNVAIRHLLLLAPSPPSGQPMTEQDRAETIAGWGKRGAMEKMLKSASVLPVAAPLAECFVADNLRVTKPAWDAWQNEGSQEDISGRVAGIEIPTTVLSGEHDPVISPGLQASDTISRLQDARLQIVPGAGHLLAFETPQAVIDALQKILDGIDAVKA